MSDKTLDLSEHVETLFEGVEGVTDEQKTKMETVLEAAVTSVVASKSKTIQEEADAKVEELVEAKTAELEGTLSKYLDYVISEWMDENKLALEVGLKVEQAQSFFDGMKALFVEHNVEVPAGKEDLVESHEAKIAELEAKLNEATNKAIEMSSKLDEVAKQEIVAEAAEGLTDTQKEKFDSLVEGIEFSNADSYKTKVQTIRESYFKQSAEAEVVTEAAKKPLHEAGSDDPVAQRLASLRNPYAAKA